MLFGYAPGCMVQEEDGGIWGNDLLLHPYWGVIQKLGFWEFFSSPLNKGVAEVVNIYQHKFSRFY